MIYVSNALSLNFLPSGESILSCKRIDIERARTLAKSQNLMSIVGHKDLALVLSNLLGVPIKKNRVSAILPKGSTLLVGQYHGPRLPEGTTILPESVQIEFWEVRVR